MSDTEVAADSPARGKDHHVSVDPAAVSEPRSAADGGPDMVQLLTPEGERVPHPEYDEIVDRLSHDELRELYRDLVLIRRVDQEATALQRQGELGLWASLLGQEAAQIGAGRAMRRQDHAFPGYREHGIAWTRGLDPMRLIAMYRGVDRGAWDPAEFGFHPYTIVIGNQALLGTGYAMGIQRDGAVGTGDESRDAAVIACMGDGATAQGDNNEAFVFAGVYNSPIVFFCQNNQWAISEPNERQTRAPIYKRADGFGFPGIRVDGNDVLGVYAVVSSMLDRARSGEGPSLIEAYTYRMAAHTTSDDPTKYRISAEVEVWKLRDPIARYQRWLMSEGIADAEFFEAVDREADELGEKVRRETVGMTDPPTSDMFDHVYDGPHRQVEDDAAAFAAYQASFEDAAEPATTTKGA
ncbi:pyruvate dehydrogenase E1 component alpha subunit [Knoellia remsis]|uniref:Pyruvate dehydrogenase E1 component alpha subunit n=2 Tax=Knoellia remsis TaxID=407159 RepID=A0A2T0UCZ3_9MICO|nr:pyruvate dehydrogenase E1 component alpha subunit [Knoellia remsis]